MLMNEFEAAEYLQLSVLTLRKYRRTKTGPGYARLGKLVRYSKEDLRQWYEQCRVEPKSEEIRGEAA